MPVNVEIKARVPDFKGVQRRIEALSDSPPELLWQEDYYFSVAAGRLKLRIEDPIAATSSPILALIRRVRNTRPTGSLQHGPRGSEGRSLRGLWSPRGRQEDSPPLSSRPDPDSSG